MAGYNLMTLMLVGVRYVSCSPTPLDDITINLNLLDITEDVGLTDYETLDEDLEMKAGQASGNRPVVIGGYNEKGALEELDEVYSPHDQKWVWMGGPPLDKPDRRAGWGVATLNNEIYIAGGLDSEKLPRATVFKRTLSTDWQILPTLKEYRAFATLITVEMLFDQTVQKVLVIAGGEDLHKNPMNSTEVRHLDGNWYPNPPMKEARAGHAAVVLNNKIYVLGGKTAASKPKPSKTTEIFNPLDSTWNEGPPMMEKRSRHAATVLGETIYICGGQQLEGKTFVHLQSCEYGNGKDQFKKLADMKVPRSFFAILTVDGDIWAIGGFNGAGKEALKTVEIYDPAAQMWKDGKPLQKPRWVFGATTVILAP